MSPLSEPMTLIREARDVSGSGLVVLPSAEIESSQQINDEENADANNRQKRSFYKKHVVVTESSTVTITSYSIVPSTITKSITLGIVSCTKCVSCLPSGINIC